MSPRPCTSSASPTLTSSASGPTRLLRTPRGLRHRLKRRTVRPARRAGDAADLRHGDDLAAASRRPGMITFQLYGPDDAPCSGEPDLHVDGRRSTATAPYNSEPFTPTAAGTYRWVVSYSGDENNHPAGPTDCDEPIRDDRDQPGPAHDHHRGLRRRGSSASRSPISATLSGGANPTGDDHLPRLRPRQHDCSGPPADTSTVDVHGNGTYTSDAVHAHRAGTYRWVASYSGDGDNEAATTSCGDPGEARRRRADRRRCSRRSRRPPPRPRRPARRSTTPPI